MHKNKERKYLPPQGFPCNTGYPAPVLEHDGLKVDSIRLRWKVCDANECTLNLGRDITFQIHCWCDDEDQKHVKTPASNYTISKMKFGSFYSAYVVVTDGQRDVSPPSNTVDIFVDLLSPPDLDEHIERPDMHSVKIRWTLMNNDMESLCLNGNKVFRIYYWSAVNDLKYVETNATEYSIKGLAVDLTYSAYVIVMDGENKISGPSKAIDFKTVPRAPENIEVANYQPFPHDSLIVSFDAKQGDGVVHKITIAPADLRDEDQARQEETARTQALIRGLTPGKSYYVTVQTQEEELCSQLSSYTSLALLCKLNRKGKFVVFF